MYIVVLSGPAVELRIVQAGYATSHSRSRVLSAHELNKPCLSLYCLTTRVSLQLSGSVTCSLSLSLGYCAVPAPRVVLSKNLAPKLCPRGFSASRTARLRDVDWSRLCRIQHGVRAVGFCLVHFKPSRPLVMRVIESRSPRQAPPAPRVGFCVSRQNSWP